MNEGAITFLFVRFGVCVYESLWRLHKPRNRISGPRCIHLLLADTLDSPPKWPYQFKLPSVVYTSSPYFTSSSTPDIASLFNLSNSGGCTMALILVSLMTNGIEHFSIWISFVKSHFSIRLPSIYL